VNELSPKALEVHQALATKEQIEIRYESRDNLMNGHEIATALARERSTDVIRGTTSLGPHRDDLVIVIDDQDARKFGSQGQQRTAIIALKFAALEIAKERLGVPPILLLDDIFSDLDEGRRERLVEWITRAVGQAVLTCTEASAAGTTIQERARVFEVSSGKIKMQETGQ
jgi:DNA replication and repair protein RecF